jgi:biopolymer transport protein ExbD
MQVQDDKPYDDINVTPMLDLAYVLLVIFILMCTASVQGMKVVLPTASKASAPMSKPKTKSITIDNQGDIHLDATPVTLQELEQRLAQARSENPDFPLILRGDSVTQYQKIMDVLDVAGRVGITQVGLASKPNGK